MRRLLTVAKAAALTLMLAAMAGDPLPAEAGMTAAENAELAKENARKAFANAARFGSGPVGKSAFAGAAGRSSELALASAGRSTGKAKRSRYDVIIARHAAAQGVPLALAHAVIRIESNYRANARGSAGEVGLMQIKPSTARGLGYAGSAKGLYNPETNIRYGMKYLGEAHRLGGGDICGTILKYNAGHYAKRMNKVSAAYCVKVKRQMAKAGARVP